MSILALNNKSKRPNRSIKPVRSDVSLRYGDLRRTVVRSGEFHAAETRFYKRLTLEHLFYYNPSTMSIWQRLMYWIGLRESPGPRYYQLSESLHVTLSTLASRENRTEQEIAKDIFSTGLTQYYETFELWDLWESLTPREQEVTALVCLGYTNRQAAVRMSISPETVKYHLHNVMRKYGLKSRVQLQQLLKEWDFSAWQ
jgi:DNA-binding CsgD family transcriptional regulator